MLTDFNHARFQPGALEGHYESFFVRANHPSRPQAFWLRYTVFSPRGKPEAAIGELWAMVFDGRDGRHTVVKEEIPAGNCEFSRDRFFVRIGDAVQEPGRVEGVARHGDRSISWRLRYDSDSAPVLMLPENLYAARFPRAKSLVGLPMARFAGSLRVGTEELPVDGWRGSQNHNWGSRHTDRYAYGQVCGFDNAPESFLEMASARLRIGPLWTPLMTPIVLRHGGREYALNGLVRSIRNRARYRYFNWQFTAEDEAIRIEGEIRAPQGAFVGLRYYNPPGGDKYCLNSKIADCRLLLTHRNSGFKETLNATQRTAFEILTDDLDHGVGIRS